MGQPSPDERWSSTVVLANGETALIRPIRPDDAPALAAFHDRQSAESNYRRFFSPKPHLTQADLEHFTVVDMVDRVALVVEHYGEFIAWASYERWPGRDDADAAFQVDDAHQGKGIATLLLEHLAAIARSNGIVRFTAEVLADNRPMLSVFSRAGWPVERRFESGVVDLDFPLDDTEEFLDSVERREQRADSRAMARLLLPRTIAVIGASDDPGSIGNALWTHVTSTATSDVHPVNPAHDVVGGQRSWPRVQDVPADVSLAIIVVPAGALPGVIEDCIAARVRGAIVITSIEGTDIDMGPIVTRARSFGLRLIGPGSMGVASPRESGGVQALLVPADLRPGGVAISLQSGSLGASVLRLADDLHMGLSWFVSLGNKCDVSGNDLLQFWEDDETTRVVAMYTESFGNPRKFARIARRVSRVKPVVAVMSGDGDSPLVTDALYQQAGVIRVTTVAELLAVARLLAGQPLPEGHRVAVVTNSASPALLALAAARSAGLVPAQLSEATRAAVLDGLPPDVRVGAFVDLSPQAGPEDVARVLPLVLADPGVDAVTVIHAPPVARGTEELRSILTTAARGSTKPLVAVALGLAEGMAADDDAVRAAAEGDQQPSQAGQVPLYTFPEAAMAALGRVARYAAWRRRPEGVPLQPEGVDLARIEALVADVLAVHPDGATLPFERCVALLAAAGVPFADARVVGDAASAAEAADDLGYPVALKATGVQRLARSERGGVGLDLQSPAEVRAAYARMAASLGERMGGAVVQRMVPPGVELSAELRLEPLGPVLTFGLGGAYADLIADRSARVLPLTDHDAADLLAGSRAAPLVADVPGLHAALVDLFGRLATVVDAVPELVHLRLNPMLGSAEGLWAVDVTASVAPARVPEGFRRVL